MGKKSKIDVAAFEKQLKAVAEQAIQDTITDEVIPNVKHRLSKKTKHELQDMTPKSNAVLSTDPEAISGYINTKKGVRRVLSSESYIKNTALKKNSNDWEFTVFFDVAPDDPIWKWNNGDANSVGSDGELFAQWMVDGKLVVHPALSQYRGKIINGTNYENPYFDVTEDNYTWQKYVKDYSFKQIPFVDHTIKELNKDKNFINDIQKSISNKISKGLKK